jgi:hypothetical protein
MNDKVTLDHIDFQKIRHDAEATRAEYMRQQATAASMVVGSTLRAHSIIAVVAILVVSFAVKMFYMSPPTAEAERSRAVQSTNMDIFKMQVDHPNLPQQQINDMTFVDPLP